MVFGHRERDHNTCGVWAVGSVRKGRKAFTTVRYGESTEGLTWKPFGLRAFGEVDAE